LAVRLGIPAEPDGGIVAVIVGKLLVKLIVLIVVGALIVEEGSSSWYVGVSQATVIIYNRQETRSQ